MTPLIIQQTPDEAKLAAEINRNCEMAAVRLRKSRLTSSVPEELPEGRLRSRFSHKAKTLPSASKAVLRFEIDFRMTGYLGDEGQGADDAVLSVECSFEVTYACADGFSPQDEAVRAFREGNAIFNCWPYFREYLQSSLLRMGYPPFAAPFLRLLPKPLSKNKKPLQ